MDDLHRVVERLESQKAPQRGAESASFAHGVAASASAAPTGSGVGR